MPLLAKLIPALIVLVGAFRFPAPAGMMRVSFLVLMELAVFIAAGVWVAAKYNRWVGAFLILAAVSSIYPAYTRWSYLAAVNVLLGSLWYVLVIESKVRPAAVCNALCVLALINLFVMVLQELGWMPFMRGITGSDPSPAIGLMANQNETSALFALCLPAFLRPRWIWGLIPLFAGLVAAKTTGGFLAALAALGVIFIWGMELPRLKQAALAAVGGMILALFFIFVDLPGFERLEVWKKAAELYPQHWLSGFGVGNWKIVFYHDLIGGARWTMAHNEFIQGWFEMGIVFPILAAGYLVQTVRRMDWIHVMYAAALLVIVVNSMVNFLFHIAVTAMIAVTWLALMEMELRDREGFA